MSRNTTVKLVMAATLILAAYFGKDLFTKSQPQISPKHQPHLLSQNHLKMTKKLESPFQIKISQNLAEPLVPGKEFVLLASMQSTKNINEVSYEWRLPEGVQFVAGRSKGSLDNVTAGTSYDFQVTLKTEKIIVEPIHFVAQRAQGPQQETRSVQYLPFGQQEKDQVLKDASKKVYETNDESQSQEKVYK